MTLSTDVITFLSALTEAGSLFVASAGLTLVFGAMRIINIAHGSLYMYGAFLVTTLAGAAGGGRFWLALAIAPLAVAGIGAVMEVSVLRRVYRRDHLVQLVVTYALFLIFADLALHLWGTQARSVATPSLLSGSVPIGSGRFPVYDLFAIGAAIAVGLGMWVLLQRTALGWRIRAAVEDPETLATSGTNVPLLSTTVFAIGALLAGVAGAVASPLQSISPGVDGSIIVAAFIVAVIGGLGSVTGAAIGAVIISLFDTGGVLWAHSWEPAFIYLAMIVVLTLRPWGLLGTPER
jgi:branched-subunit amino acid ABC-type transport system permease component